MRHIYLQGLTDSVPDRWSEAFPQHQVVPVAGMAAWLRGNNIVFDLIWLNSADAQWPTQAQTILAAEPQARLVLLSGAPTPQEGLLAVNAGVRGYTHAHAVPALLREVAVVVEHGGLWVGPDLLRRLVGSTSTALASRPSPTPAPGGQAQAALSARELEVATVVAQGRSNREVAELLHISERTVKAHLGMVFEKLGVRDRLQLALRMSAGAET